MIRKFQNLLHIAMSKKASDIHFVKQDDQLMVTIRGECGIEKIADDYIDLALYQYIKYIAHLDLNYGMSCDSTSFQHIYQNKMLQFRFSLISTIQKETAVLRILSNHKRLTLYDLSDDINVTKTFENWCRLDSGLIVLSGPTGSGKTTTLHALLSHIAKNDLKRVVSLEDPIEIVEPSYLQLQINEKADFSYEEGIKQLLRHDPDVIMIGEIRDTHSAKMLIRAALSGHLVFTTIHGGNAIEVILRFLELNVAINELQQVLCGITSQRIFYDTLQQRKVCIYEIATKKEIEYYFNHQKMPKNYQNIQSLVKKANQNYNFETHAD